MSMDYQEFIDLFGSLPLSMTNGMYLSSERGFEQNKKPSLQDLAKEMKDKQIPMTEVNKENRTSFNVTFKFDYDSNLPTED